MSGKSQGILRRMKSGNPVMTFISVVTCIVHVLPQKQNIVSSQQREHTKINCQIKAAASLYKLVWMLVGGRGLVGSRGGGGGGDGGRRNIPLTTKLCEDWLGGVKKLIQNRI